MSKQALCILASNFSKLAGVSEVIRQTDTLTVIKMDKNETLFDIPSFLEPRATCESDPTRLQILPYVTLNHIQDEGELYVYTYQRGGGSGEKRLMGDYSVGFGGHIEEAPTAEHSLKDVVIDCVLRELEEELNLKVSRFKVELALQHAKIFLDTSNDVGKVHLALAISLQVDPKELGESEEGVVEKVKLERYADIFADMMKPETTDRKFESWSRIVMGF